MVSTNSAARTFVLAVALTSGAATAAAQEPASERQVDLELVLAVDVSSSVSAEEFELQIRGLAEAFGDSRVVQAIRTSGDLGVAVALVQWSGDRKQVLAIDWTLVRDQESALVFSHALADTPRFLVGGGTAIGAALEYAIAQIEGNGFVGRRKVIDVSGDGRANQGVHPIPLRDAAVALGITINGLAILNEDRTVDGYYLANVIGGTGAFVMTANDYQAYAQAILTKLIKEIAGAPIAARPRDRQQGIGQGIGAGDRRGGLAAFRRAGLEFRARNGYIPATPPWGATSGTPSSRGLGHRPFKAATRVRTPLGSP